jgi:hypothetical protein
MSEILLGILMAPLALLIYGSGLLLWPLRRWRYRGQKLRGRALVIVFSAQAAAYLAVGCCSIFIRLGHFYYWFIFLLELNIVFTIAGIFAWRRDGRYERSLERPPSA